MVATITRRHKFSSAHRVMNEKVKCFNLHGHEWYVEMTFEFENKLGLGYAIDFKEIKRIGCAFIDEFLDHACICNPKDTELIDLCRKNNWKTYIMGFDRDEDINPSAENLASELYYILGVLFNDTNIRVSRIRLYETENCWVDYTACDYVPTDDSCVNDVILRWRAEKGDFNYDIREGK